MMYLCKGDLDNIEMSLIIYDALYSYCRGKLVEINRPEILELPLPQRWDTIKGELRQHEGDKS